MLEDNSFWKIRPRYGWIRILFPIYGVDQLIALLLIVVLVALLYSFDPLLAQYVGAGTYIGFMISMVRSTPSCMAIPKCYAEDAVAILDSSPYLVRQTGKIWTRDVSRLQKWHSDDIYFTEHEELVVIFGRYVDIQQVKRELCSEV